MTQPDRHPKSQVRIESKDLDADKTTVDRIFLAAADKFALYDNTHTSQVPDTIRSIVEAKGFGFGLGARMVANAIYVDFMRHRSASSKFDEVHDFILGGLKNAFQIELVEILEDNPSYCKTSWK